MPTVRDPHRARGAATTIVLLWIFVVLNYLYCDVLGLMDAELLGQYLTGEVDGIKMTEGFLLGSSVLMEIPMVMVVVSALAPQRASRLANVAAGTIMALVQAASLLVGDTTSYYLLFSVIEISCTAAIVWIAARWTAPVSPATG